eukprot:3104346-Rhodomonas_salina.1
MVAALNRVCRIQVHGDGLGLCLSPRQLRCHRPQLLSAGSKISINSSGRAPTASDPSLLSPFFTNPATHNACTTQVGQALRSGSEGSGDESVQLRILQCITASMQAPSLLSSKTVVSQLIESILALFGSKSPVSPGLLR